MRRSLSLFLALLICLCAVPVTAESVQDMLGKASEYLADNDFEKALASFILAQKLAPEEEAAYLGEANVHLLSEDYESASAAIDKVLTINPVSPDAWRMKCLTDALTGDMTAFEEDAVFASVCGVDISSDPASLGTLCAQAGFFRQAAEFFSKADAASLDHAQRRLYKKALVETDQASLAESLGLTRSGNEALDAAFEGNTLSLVPAEPPAISADDFVISDDMWVEIGLEAPDDPFAILEEFLPEAVVEPLSFSPAGNSALYLLDEAGPICMYEGSYRILYPSVSRGVADEYEDLAYFYNNIDRIIRSGGVVYSPDGRYAAVYSVEYSLQRINGSMEPILIDLSTGELFLTAAHINKFSEPGFGVMTTACFSEDNRFFYYILYGNSNAHLTSLYRYDLTTGETEMCFSGYDTTYYPQLSHTAEGDLIILRDAQRTTECAGVVSMSESNGQWSAQAFDNPLPIEYWNPRQLAYSPVSGYALAIGAPRSYRPFALQLLLPSEGFDGFDRFITIATGTGEVSVLSGDEFTALADSAASERIGTPEFPYDIITGCQLSPDGSYALVTTRSVDKEVPVNKMYLLRLDDLQLREITVPESHFPNTYNPEMKIEWNADTLIIGSKMETVSFRFE